MPSPRSDSLKAETTQPKLPQEPSGTRRSRVGVCPELSETWGPGGPAGMGSSRECRDTPTPALLTSWVFTAVGSVLVPFAVTERAAIWCRGWLQLGASPRRGCAFGRGSEPAPFPQTPFRQLRKAVYVHKDLLLFIPSPPSSACQLVSTPLFKNSRLG